MHRLPPLAALLAALLLPLSAWGLTIDDFSGSTQSVTDCTLGGAVSSEEAHSVLGGARHVGTFSTTDAGCVTASAGGGSGSISTDSSGSGSGGFSYDGNVNGVAQGTNGQLNIDLTQGGTLDRFQLEVLSVSFSSSPTVAVRDSDSNSVVIVSAPGPGTYEILFSSYSGIDFTDVKSIQLSEVLESSDDSIVFGSFSAIPEPSTALLVALGLAGLAAARGRRTLG